MPEKIYRLLYKVGYRHSDLWKYERFDVRAGSLEQAKAKVRRSHPKATKLEFQYIVR